MIAEPFRAVATLATERLVLEPLGPQHLEGTWAALHDEEARRLTGTTATFTRERIVDWLAGLAAITDRADWAIVVRGTGEHIGELVLNELDTENESANFRIALAGPAVYGRGYGTEATRAVLEHAFRDVGLHRVQLEVFDFNPRARRAYEKAGFVEEGRMRDALLQGGARHDAIVMSALATDPAFAALRR